MRLRELREKKGLQQNEVANQLKIGRTSLNQYENEKNQPPLQILIQLADYYGVSLDYLCEHETKSIADYGVLTQQQKMAISIMLKLPEQYFYEFVGRLKTTADMLRIQY